MLRTAWTFELWFQMGFTDGTSFYMGVITDSEYVDLNHVFIPRRWVPSHVLLFQDLKVTLAITTCLVFVMILWNYHLILVKTNIGCFFWYNFLPRQMRWPLVITRKDFNCLNFRNLISGAAASALWNWSHLASVLPLKVIHLFFFLNSVL